MPESIKRKRLLVTDLHPDHFRSAEFEGKNVIVVNPNFQFIGNGIDPNSTSLDPINGAVALANNGTLVTKTWYWNGTRWLGA